MSPSFGNEGHDIDKLDSPQLRWSVGSRTSNMTQPFSLVKHLSDFEAPTCWRCWSSSICWGDIAWLMCLSSWHCRVFPGKNLEIQNLYAVCILCTLYGTVLRHPGEHEQRPVTTGRRLPMGFQGAEPQGDLGNLGWFVLSKFYRSWCPETTSPSEHPRIIISLRIQ